jgi:hypothetical protein
VEFSSRWHSATCYSRKGIPSDNNNLDFVFRSYKFFLYASASSTKQSLHSFVQPPNTETTSIQKPIHTEGIHATTPINSATNNNHLPQSRQQNRVRPAHARKALATALFDIWPLAQVKPPRPPMLTQQPLEHISQLVLVHCVAPLVEQVAQEVPAAASAAEGEAAAPAAEGEAAAPAAEGAAAAPAAEGGAAVPAEGGEAAAPAAEGAAAAPQPAAADVGATTGMMAVDVGEPSAN